MSVISIHTIITCFLLFYYFLRIILCVLSVFLSCSVVAMTPAFPYGYWVSIKVHLILSYTLKSLFPGLYIVLFNTLKCTVLKV